MPSHDKAQDYLLPGETAICVHTDGRNLKINKNGTGTTGVWVINPSRKVDRVIVVRVNAHNGHKLADVITARYNGVEATDGGRYAIRMVDVVMSGTTDKNWKEFANGSQNPVRYISRAIDDDTPSLLALADFDTQSEGEGARNLAIHQRIERDLKIVAAKRMAVMTSHGTLACEVCSFNFQSAYGQIGLGFCEVHHLIPLSKISGNFKTKLENLSIVCSNCHRMIHRKDPCFTIEELKQIQQQAESGRPD